MSETLARHTMVIPARDAWAELLASRQDLAAEPLVRDWGPFGHPLVVRQRVDADAAAGVPVGLPLPPSHGKRRIALTLAATGIANRHRPPLLAEAAQAAPAAWRATIDRLVALDPSTRVFGSLAWQHITGLGYVSDRSGRRSAPAAAHPVGAYPAAGRRRFHSRRGSHVH